nr:hypothetical protein GCM10025699_35100 [Microbacterium flavescens]
MTRHTTRALLGTGALLITGALALTACGSGFDDDGGGGTGDGDGGATELTSSDDALTVLIGSSGDAETEAVESAVAAWSEESGVEASVQVANDLPQQLSQGFAAGSPPDLFYLATEAIAGYAGNGSSSPTATCSRTPTTSTRRSSRTSPWTTSSTAPRRTSRRSVSSSTRRCGMPRD